ncbi:srpk [Purpureocillium lavendulum]|uniref:Srpk n=1 Tax=Purpureocillium lavendulum TaxID=1247861 RepID=A0AB34G1G3_9HYPO|nr:srpk [Purpureocillium lavendulum]
MRSQLVSATAAALLFGTSALGAALAHPVEAAAAAAVTPAVEYEVDMDFLLGRRADATTTAAAGTTNLLQGTLCFTTSTTTTTSCPLTTSGKHVLTQTCFPTAVPASECKKDLMCTIDSNNEDICMHRRDALDIGGIIIAIVFAVLITLGLGTLTFLCCKDRREQKRLAAKAEAVALARAQTKKKRAQEQRTPLMQQQQTLGGAGAGGPGSGRGSPNPFNDTAH